MAVLRCGLDGADVQRRRVSENSGRRDSASQRRADPEPLRAERRDALHRTADVQETRLSPDQAAVARRPERADQLQEYLDQGALTPLIANIPNIANIANIANIEGQGAATGPLFPMFAMLAMLYFANGSGRICIL